MRARALGVQEAAVDRDFVLCCLLAAHAADPGPLVFRGGTALARAYWFDYRLSEDLDFISGGPVQDLEDRLTRLAGRAQVDAGISLQIEVKPTKGGWSRSIVAWADAEVVIDVNMNEESAIRPHRVKIGLPYEQFKDREASVPTCVLPEILGNKWLILDDRNEPRDLFDIWWGLCQTGVEFADLAAGHLAKYRFLPVRQTLNRAKKRMLPLWEDRLAHQMQSLPKFEEVLADVLAVYDTWEEKGKRVSELEG